MSREYSKQLGKSSLLVKVSDVDAIAKAQGTNLDLAEVYNSTFGEKDAASERWIPFNFGRGAPHFIDSGSTVRTDVLDGLLNGYIPRTYNPDLLAQSALSSSFQAFAAGTGKDIVKEARLLSRLEVRHGSDGNKSLYVPPNLKGPRQDGPPPPFRG